MWALSPADLGSGPVPLTNYKILDILFNFREPQFPTLQTYFARLLLAMSASCRTAFDKCLLLLVCG